jgi:hypothetical protein
MSSPTPWRVHELVVAGACACTFTGPGGETFVIPAFDDGSGTWRVRFAPTVPGVWRWEAAGQAGTFDVLPADGDNPLFRHGGFLRVSANGRYLTYTDGTPFFWLGDTWWFCPSALMPIDGSNRPEHPSMYKALIDRRVAQGFTTVHWAFLGASGVNGSYTDLFRGEINADYWRTVDRYIDYANAAGIIPVIGLGFHHGLDAPSLEELQQAWGYVLARYGAHAASWLICGEYNLASQNGEYSDTDRARIEKVLALGQFIKDHDPYRRAMTVHPWWHGGDRRQAWATDWYDFILLQGGHGAEGPAPAVYRDIYATQARPLLEGEVTYEGIFGFSDAVVRGNAYKAIQCGSFGFTYGAHGLWYPTQDETDDTFKDWGAPIPWWEAVMLPGAAQLTHLRACYASVDWWTLAPCATTAWLDVDLAAAERILVKANAETAIIYLPAGLDANITLRGNGSPTLVDPRTGVVSTLSNTTPLALPCDGQDWVVVVRK